MTQNKINIFAEVFICITHNTEFVQVLENLQSSVKLFYMYSSKNVWQTVRRINIEILGVKGLIQILESWKLNLSQDWKSP